MFDLIAKHEFWAAVGAYWIFSAAVSSMPVPSSNNGAGYLWVFRFLHTLAGNVTTVFGSRIPGAPTVAAVAALAATALLLTSSGCAAHYPVHPASLSTDDSAAYDALLIAQGTIDQARTALKAGQLPGSAKETLNALINSYNVARTSWLTYRGALATDLPSDVYLAQLTLNLTDLTNAIRDFKQKEEQ
jgi:hypothetical protein